MNIKASELQVKDRVLVDGFGARMITRIVPRIGGAWLEIECGARVTLIAQAGAEIELADPEFVINPDRLVKVDYPECPRFEYRKSYGFMRGFGPGLPR